MISLSSCICIVAYHLGTVDVQCMDVKHVMMELNPKMTLVDVSRREKDQLEKLKTRPKVGRAQGLASTNNDLVLSQASPGA